MRTVELTQDECDALANLLRQQQVPVAHPEAIRVMVAYLSVLRKVTADAPAGEPPYRRGLRAADEVVGAALASWKRKAEIATEHEVKEEARTVAGVLAEIKDEINELFTTDTKKE